MAIDVNGRPEPVPLGRSNTDQHVRTNENTEVIQAGNLAGDNLGISYGSKGEALVFDSQGIPIPKLNTPNQEQQPDINERTLDDIEQILAGWDNGIPAGLTPKNNPAGITNGPSVESINVELVDSGFEGVLNGDKYNVDIINRNVEFSVEGKRINLQYDENGNFQHTTADDVPFSLGDDEIKSINYFYVLLELFHKIGVETRQAGREDRNLANKDVVEKIKEQAVKQLDAAFKRLMAGVVSGGAKVVSGGLGAIGSIKAVRADAAAGGRGRPGDVIAQQWNSYGRAFEGGVDVAASGVNYGAAKDEFEVTELRAEEEQARFRKTTSQDWLQTGHELSTKARDTFLQVVNQQQQAQSHTIRNI